MMNSVITRAQSLNPSLSSLIVSGAVQFSSTLNVAGNLSNKGVLSQAGAAQFSSSATFAGDSTFGATMTALSSAAFSIRTNIPTTFTANGIPGQIAVTQNANTATSGHIYWCFATNTWTRLAPVAQTNFN